MSVSEEIKKKATCDAEKALKGWLRLFYENSETGPIHKNINIKKTFYHKLEDFLKVFASPYHIKDYLLRMERRKAFMNMTIDIEGQKFSPFEFALIFAPKEIIPLWLNLFNDDYTYLCTNNVTIKIAKDPELKSLILKHIVDHFYFKGNNLEKWYNQERLGKIISHFPEIIYLPIGNEKKQLFGAYLLSFTSFDPFVFFDEAIKKSKVTPIRFLEFVVEYNPEYTYKAVKNTSSRYKISKKQIEYMNFLISLATVDANLTYPIVTAFMETSSYPQKIAFPDRVLAEAYNTTPNNGIKSLIQASFAYVDTRNNLEKENLLQQTYKTFLRGNNGNINEKLVRWYLLANYSSPQRNF